MAKKGPITEAVHKLLAASGESEYSISKATGVSAAALSRFRRRECGLTLTSLDALAEHFGWRLVADEPTKKKRRT